MSELQADKIAAYENFPTQLVLLSTIVTLGIYVNGALIMAGLGNRGHSAVCCLLCLG